MELKTWQYGLPIYSLLYNTHYVIWNLMLKINLNRSKPLLLFLKLCVCVWVFVCVCAHYWSYNQSQVSPDTSHLAVRNLMKLYHPVSLHYKQARKFQKNLRNIMAIEREMQSGNGRVDNRLKEEARKKCVFKEGRLFSPVL